MQKFTANSWKLIVIRDFWWLNSRPVTVKNATLYFYLLSWHFFFWFFIKIFVFIIFISFLDEVSYFRNRILNQTKHLWWITWQKKLTAFSHWLFLQKTPSYLFDRVLNMPLDYLSWLAMVLRYVDTQEGWYVANWL